MSTIGDALQGIRELLLMQHKIEQLEESTTRIGANVAGLADAVSGIDRRVARIEGYIEGRTGAPPGPPLLSGT